MYTYPFFSQLYKLPDKVSFWLEFLFRADYHMVWYWFFFSNLSNIVLWKYVFLEKGVKSKG